MNHLWVVGGDSPDSIGESIMLMATEIGVFDKVSGTGQHCVDVRSAESIHWFINECGPFTHVAYCAGIASLQYIDQLDIQEVANVFDTNVFGFMRVMRSLALTHPGGRVCAITSDASRVPMRGSMAYCSSKAALNMAIKQAARELAPNWSINGVAPAMVDDTNMTRWIDATVPEFRGWTEEYAREYETMNIPMGRRALKDEVAAVVLTTLLGPSFMTGSIIDITGGK